MRERRRRRDTTGRAGPAGGFTLVELLIVMVIVSVIIAFILTAATGGIRQAETRATQALIMKLDSGVSDRLEALLSTRVDSFFAHYYMASIANSGFPSPPPPAAQGVIPPFLPGGSSGQYYIPSVTRAQIIARYDQVKAEFPDVFAVMLKDKYYLLNFAATPYPGTAVPYGGLATATSVGGTYGNYLLPLGIGVLNDMTSGSFGSNPGTPIMSSPPYPPSMNNASYNFPGPPQSTGIFGASYTAAAGLTKNLVAEAVRLGATAPKPINRGYDGVDNDGNGLIDDVGENGASVASGMAALLAKHTHKTARSEMLYALLVEGQGALGSVFSRDDFSDREVQDTDGDGLPEFVDAWGEPVQFFRWPVFYNDDLQLGTPSAGVYVSAGTPNLQVGSALYNGTFQPRQVDGLDQNQSLLNPAWWGSFNNATPFGAGGGPLSGPALLFQSMFNPLTDPNYPANSTYSASVGSVVWDRGATSGRRSFFSKYLVISGGPDKAPGVAVLDPAYYNAVSGYLNTISLSSLSLPAMTGASSGNYTAAGVPDLMAENQAAQATPNRVNNIYWTRVSGGSSSPVADDDLTQAIQQAGADDITSHNVQAPGGAVQ